MQCVIFLMPDLPAWLWLLLCLPWLLVMATLWQAMIKRLRRPRRTYATPKPYDKWRQANDERMCILLILSLQKLEKQELQRQAEREVVPHA